MIVVSIGNQTTIERIAKCVKITINKTMNNQNEPVREFTAIALISSCEGVIEQIREKTSFLILAVPMGDSEKKVAEARPLLEMKLVSLLSKLEALRDSYQV